MSDEEIHTTNTLHILWHGSQKSDLAIGCAISLLDGELGLTGSQRVTGLIHIASVWPGTVSIDGIHGDGELSTLGNGGDGLVSQLSLSLGSDIDVSTQQSSSTLVGDILGDLSGVDDVGISIALEGEWQTGG